MFKSILVPVDLDDEKESKAIFASALEIARSVGAKLSVLSVVPSFSMPMVASFFPADFEKKALKEALKSLTDFVADQDGADLVEKTLVGHGSVYKEIVGAAEEIKADVIVLGPGSTEEGDYLLGHNAARVMRHAHCSVMLLRD